FTEVRQGTGRIFARQVQHFAGGRRHGGPEPSSAVVSFPGGAEAQAGKGNGRGALILAAAHRADPSGHVARVGRVEHFDVGTPRKIFTDVPLLGELQVEAKVGEAASLVVDEVRGVVPGLNGALTGYARGKSEMPG